ncbi:MAG: bifunctional glutamate N-acetyltransferase/amino-acid acetyltransferase ArgJ [Treponema sp.]|nr:bifunctional glutamate N-acetyltransferase/amino-acid acetyltransferase ArgJ [Treponema sp.]
MKEITGGVCAPKGFAAGGIRCGIKPGSEKKDLALIYSPEPCNATGLFTTNRVKAASVLLSMECVARGKLRAIIANSGNANACTGEAGMAAARRMAQLAAEALSVEPSEVAVASTGVIGVPLPVEAIENGIADLKASLRDDEQGHDSALEAIMTTDTRKKEFAIEIEIGGKPVRIGCMAKGSGMIHPKMATMLSFITTDAVIDTFLLNTALQRAVRRSFNRLTVDGDMSTNDMVLIMASGKAGNPPITVRKDGGYEDFASSLEAACVKMVRMMARDGEGATKLVIVTVSGASDEKTAEILAKSVASSSLVKAACFGADANWGRVLCALGYAGVDFDDSKTDVSFRSKAGEIEVCKNGESVSFSEEKAKLILSEEEIEIAVTLHEGSCEGKGQGPGQASAYGCDLTYDYVKINGDYRS